MGAPRIRTFAVWPSAVTQKLESPALRTKSTAGAGGPADRRGPGEQATHRPRIGRIAAAQGAVRGERRIGSNILTTSTLLFCTMIRLSSLLALALLAACEPTAEHAAVAAGDVANAGGYATVDTVPAVAPIRALYVNRWAS